MPLRSHPSKIFWSTAALALFLWLCWRAIGTFGPPSDVNDVSFNSDSAILVLMANDDRRITIFNFYYYGASRWGAWAYLLAQLIHQSTGYHWTDKSLTIAQILWVLAGALIFARLSRREAVVAGLVYLIATCLHREARYLLFELSQVYGFQTTALLLAWLGTRRVFDTYLQPASTGAPRRRLIWLSFTVLSSFLAVWSSPASTAFLLGLVAVEGFLAYIVSPANAGGRVLLSLALTSSGVIAATIAERLQKEVYHRYSARHYGYDFNTHFGLDSGYLVQNFGKQLDHLAGLSWWPLYMIPLVAALALMCGMAYAHLARRVRLRDRLKAILAEDTTRLALGTLSIAVLNFVMAVVVDHVRNNDYDDRYLTLTNLFGPVSGMLTLVVLLKLAARSSAVERYVRPVLCAAGVMLLVSAFPRPHPSLEYQMMRDTADILARRAPNGVLMGGYWDTYVFSALQTHATMTPVPVEGWSFRTPWTPRSLESASRVVFVFRRPKPRAPVAPDLRLRQYGHALTLVDPHWYENTAFVFALYAKDTGQTAGPYKTGGEALSILVYRRPRPSNFVCGSRRYL